VPTVIDMAAFSKKSVQRLAVLRALGMWARGAYGPVRLHKTLYFADEHGDPKWTLFTFRRWHLGQYSDEIAAALNDLKAANRISSEYDGPCERIRAELPQASMRRVKRFFTRYFPEWSRGLGAAFRKWAYLSNDDILTRAQEHESYTKKNHGELIISSFDAEEISFEGIDAEEAEHLLDLVDPKLQRGIKGKLALALDRPPRGEDWRAIYFADAEC
jgi:hypothetical protein